MNRENVEYSIELMRKAKALGMSYWQERKDDCGDYACNVEELHTCGNKACFAGYVALSGKFQADGGRQMIGGMPYIDGESGDVAIAVWLDISDKLAKGLVYGDNNFYHPISFQSVQAHHVIDKLQMILSGELE